MYTHSYGSGIWELIKIKTKQNETFSLTFLMEDIAWVTGVCIKFQVLLL